MTPLNAHAKRRRSDTSLSVNHRPVIYVVAAGLDSEKFSRQLRLLSEGSDITTSLRLVMVPDTTSFLTIGWPLGVLVQMPDQRMRTAIKKRFGSVEGKYEFLIVLVDERGLVKKVSHDPLSADQLQGLLCQ